MSKPIIAPSLLSANFLNLREDIDKINSSEADWLHVESEKVGLKLNIQKTKIMASGPIT